MIYVLGNSAKLPSPRSQQETNVIIRIRKLTRRQVEHCCLVTILLVAVVTVVWSVGNVIDICFSY